MFPVETATADYAQASQTMGTNSDCSDEQNDVRSRQSRVGRRTDLSEREAALTVAALETDRPQIVVVIASATGATGRCTDFHRGMGTSLSEVLEHLAAAGKNQTN